MQPSSDPSVSPADTRYEIDVLIGPCSQAECETLMEAILDLPETTSVGGVVACGPWTGEQTRRELLAVGERYRRQIAQLTEFVENVRGNFYLWGMDELTTEETLLAIEADAAVLADEEDAK